MNEDHISDAELDAFLKGDDALARELQALEQAAPSAQLDAAILAQAAALMARPTAANDAGPAVAPAPWRFGRRWRVPAGIAAALVAGVLAQQSWQQQEQEQRRAGGIDGVGDLARPAAPAGAPPALAEPAAVVAPNAAPLQAETAPVHKRALAAPPAASAADADQWAAAPPPPPLSPAPPSAMAPAPAAPVSEVAAAKSAPGELAIMARHSRPIAPAAAPTHAVAAATATAGPPDPAAWLAAIDEMLRAGLRRDTLAEWDKFRAAYPDYPVQAATLDKINALKN